MTWSRFFDAYEPMHALVAESSALRIFCSIAALSKLAPPAIFKTCLPLRKRGAKVSDVR